MWGRYSIIKTTILKTFVKVKKEEKEEEKEENWEIVPLLSTGKLLAVNQEGLIQYWLAY